MVRLLALSLRVAHPPWQPQSLHPHHFARQGASLSLRSPNAILRHVGALLMEVPQLLKRPSCSAHTLVHPAQSDAVLQLYSLRYSRIPGV